MYKVEHINSMDDIFSLLSENPLDKQTGRYRHGFLYRGLPNKDYKLQTTLFRNCGEQQGVLEGPILRNFAKYAIVDDPSVGESIWREMFLGQHHGLPTRLLDWSYSPLIGLHFAVTEADLSNMNDHDCALWKIDINDCNENLPTEWREKLDEHYAYLFTLQMLEELNIGNLDDYDKRVINPTTGVPGIILVEPPSIDMRIVNQYSYFSIVPNTVEDMDTYLDANTSKSVKYIISKDLRWQIRDLLDCMNISERMTYPGLDGLCTWLKRHYYVIR